MHFIDDGSVEWRELYEELDVYYNNVIRGCTEYEEVYNFVNIHYKFIYDIIHNKLYDMRELEENEREIRNLVKYVINKMLPFVNVKIKEMNVYLSKKKDEKMAKLLLNMYDLEDNLFAIASFRSLTHYALYMERQDIEADKVWVYNLQECMGGIFYYANSMILNKKYKNLIKQCPTGYGKSKGDCVIMSFILGYDVNSNILKMVGNKQLISQNTQRLVGMMISPNFSKVFPQYAKYNNSKDMFKTCAIADGKLALKDSTSPMNYSCFNKDTPIDGTRYDYQFYDDVTLSDDKENVNAHIKDWTRYLNQWKKRCANELTCLRFFTGTAYHREDFISRIRKYLANKKTLLSANNNKDKWSKYCQINEDGDTVYITVPKLADYDPNNEDKCYCTFPQRNSKQEALKFLHSSANARREFMAIEQQAPEPPISLAFDYYFLLQYSTLPPKEKLERTVAIIDPNRNGKDNYACLIFNKYVEDENYYFVETYYKKTSPKISIPKICLLMAQKHVTDISFESNTTDSYLFEKEVKSTLINYGWNEFNIDSFYSYLKKDEKIAKYQDDIKYKIRFPKQGMYYEDSDMGRAMADISNYSLTGKNGNDDSIDCCAMLCIKLETKTKNEIKIFRF